MKKIVYAEDIKNFWKTSQTQPDTWIEKAKRQIERLGGNVLIESFGKEKDRAAYLLGFELEGHHFKIIWPVLESKTGNERAARIQAATMLYHDVKAKSIKAAIFGARTAFFEYLKLPDGSTASQLADQELINILPKMIINYNPPE